MLSQSLLIVEPDYGTINHLSCALADHLPNVSISTCLSAEELSEKFQRVSYDTVTLNPLFLPAYRAIQKKHNQLLAPLLVTVSQHNLTVAQAALEGDVFDVIAHPIVPSEAVHTVRLALWQNQLLKLLASHERATARFLQHLEAFPKGGKMDGHFTQHFDAFTRTFHALQSSIELLVNIENEQMLFEIATFVEHRAKQRTLNRLLTLCKSGMTQYPSTGRPATE